MGAVTPERNFILPSDCGVKIFNDTQHQSSLPGYSEFAGQHINDTLVSHADISV